MQKKGIAISIFNHLVIEIRIILYKRKNIPLCFWKESSKIEKHNVKATISDVYVMSSIGCNKV